MEPSSTGGSSRLTAACRTHGVITVVVIASLTIQLILLFTGGTDANSGESGAGVPLRMRL